MIQENTTTKDKILYLLKISDELTAKNLASKIGITEMSVRRHIEVLESDGYIVGSLIKKPVGRPVKVYKLTEKGEDTFPSNYKEYLLELVTYLELEGMNETVMSFFEKKYEKMFSSTKTDIEIQSFTDVVRNVVDIQKQMGYMADFDIIKGNMAEIKEIHCPISQLSCQHPEICQCEKDSIQKLFPNQEVQMQSSLAEGDKICSFLIKPKS